MLLERAYIWRNAGGGYCWPIAKSMILSLSLVLSTTAVRAADCDLQYDKDTEQLSLDCKNVSLSRLAKDLEAETGVKMEVSPEAERQITVSIKNATLERALERIGDESGRIFHYASGTKGGKRRLALVEFLDGGNASGSKGYVPQNHTPEPTYSEPEYSEPEYQEPVYAEPTYEEPMYEPEPPAEMFEVADADEPPQENEQSDDDQDENNEEDEEDEDEVVPE